MPLPRRRRQALDRGAALLSADKVATGHNADDIAETLLLNVLRGDLPRLGRWVCRHAACDWHGFQQWFLTPLLNGRGGGGGLQQLGR